MIIRNTPKNSDDYIVVDSNTSIILHKNGFYPRFISVKNNEYFIYYVKSDEILDFMQNNNLVALQ